ncbi:MAG: hypothetical protein N2053_05690 [Chitinispirillaceae bacterium]|nr:hypothetical protein [Chitinispirillaceae bacterium]
MKRKISIFIFLFLVMAKSTNLFAWATSEGSCYVKGDKIASAGLSIYPFGGYVVFDYGIHDCISAGLGTGYNGYSIIGYVHYHRVPIMARALFHPFNLEALADKILIRNTIDLYVGLTMGATFVWISTDNPLYTPQEKSGFRIREVIGGRYQVTEKLSFFIEDSYSLSTIAIGVNYKL